MMITWRRGRRRRSRRRLLRPAVLRDRVVGSPPSAASLAPEFDRRPFLAHRGNRIWYVRVFRLEDLRSLECFQEVTRHFRCEFVFFSRSLN